MGAGAGLQNDSSVLHLLISLSRKQSSGSNVSNSNGCKDEASVACWPLTSYCVARSRLGKRKVKVLVAQSCPTLGNPMDCSLPGCSVHGILQARILEWIAMPSSRRSSQPRKRTHICYVPWIGRQVLYHVRILYLYESMEIYLIL